MTDLIFQGNSYVAFDSKNGTVHFSEKYEQQLHNKDIVDVHFLARGVPDTPTNLGVVAGYWISSRDRNDIVAVQLNIGLTGKSVTYIRKDIVQKT